MSKKLLLTSVCRPLGPKYGDAPSVLYEPHFAQVTRAQGIFSPRTVQVNYALNYIAANLETPTTVLQYPSHKELINELEKGYDYVGVSFVLATFHRMKELVSIIRKHSSDSKIILGGYGTVLDDKTLKEYGDHICRGEGVTFMRRLLKEDDKPLKHPLMSSWSKFFSIPVSKYGVICSGLGCPNGCDFCCTSHFFNRKHIKLLSTGKEIYELIQKHIKAGRSRTFVIFDEDFLLFKKRAMELRDCALKNAKKNKPFSISVFSSVKAISQYTVKEILEMGIDSLWIGYEAEKTGYSKLKGKPVKKLLKELRNNGIVILTSAILGYDYQTPKIIKKEFNELMKLKPTYAQFLLYGPVPGTPLYERVIKNDLLLEKYKDVNTYCHHSDGFTFVTKHPRMTPDELEELQEWCFKEDFKRLGPSIFRSIETRLLGYNKHQKAKSKFLRKKANRWARSIRKSYPNFLAGRLLAPSKKVKKWIKELEKKVYQEFGKPTIKERLKSIALLGAALWTGFTLKLGLFQHPELEKRTYRM